MPCKMGSDPSGVTLRLAFPSDVQPPRMMPGTTISAIAFKSLFITANGVTNVYEFTYTDMDGNPQTYTGPLTLLRS